MAINYDQLYSANREKENKGYQDMTDTMAKSIAQRQYDVDQQALRQAQESAQQKTLNAEHWGDTAAKGASMGSAFGPWGALVGGIAGSAVGQFNAFKAHQAAGDSVFKSLWQTGLDYNDKEGIGASLTHGNMLSNAMPAAGALGNAYQKSGTDAAQRQQTADTLNAAYHDPTAGQAGLSGEDTSSSPLYSNYGKGASGMGPDLQYANPNDLAHGTGVYNRERARQKAAGALPSIYEADQRR